MRILHLAPLVFAATLACSPLTIDDSPADSVHAGFVTRAGDLVSGTGTVQWIELEGGFFSIRGDDGKMYDPINLPSGFSKNGKRVRFTAKLRPDVFSIHMSGEIVELKQISGE